MDYKEMTYDDIDNLEKEIKQHRHIKGIFVGIGWGLIGLSLILMVLAIIFAFINDDVMFILSMISPNVFLGGLILLILSAAIFNRRIKIKYKLIRQAKQYLEMNRLKGLNNKQ